MKEFVFPLLVGLLLLIIEYSGFQRNNNSAPENIAQHQGPTPAVPPTTTLADQFPLPGKYKGKLTINTSLSELQISSGEYFLNIDENLNCELVSILFNERHKVGRIISASGVTTISKLGNVIFSRVGKRLEISSDATKNTACQFDFCRYE